MKTIIRLIAISGMLALSSAAFALALTPADADWQGSSPNNPDADDVETIVGTSSELTELYKHDAPSTESGGFAGSYSTTYDDASDPEDALIEYGAGPAISCPECYLLVKDGNQTPIWYIFDIGGWNGTADLNLTGFWPEQGAISHVSIFGGDSTKMPEPGTLALLGLGLFGMGLMRRRQTN